MRKPVFNTLAVCAIIFLVLCNWWHLHIWLSIGGLITLALGIHAWNLTRAEGRELADPDHFYSDWRIRVYSSLPWNIITRVIGLLRDVPMPVALREPLYGWYARKFGCRMDEAEEPSLRAYRTFGAFFNRPVKRELRRVDEGALVVSPVDGTVLHYGQIIDGRVKYVKARDFEIHEFLGPVRIQTKKGNALFQVVIYLSPGDYHGLHSPAKWSVQQKIHFPGFLFPIASYSYWKPKMLCMNERIILSGQWDHGYFSMSPIAAPYVGGIVIMNEPVKTKPEEQIVETAHFYSHKMVADFAPGDKVGEFHFGSTMVLIFEAPEDIEFRITAGQKVRYGQKIVETMKHRMPFGDIQSD